MDDKRIYQIGLTMINGIGDVNARHLLEVLGSAEAIFQEKKRLLEKVPGIGVTLSAEIRKPEVLKRAEKEIEFIDKNNINLFFIGEELYPARLRECADAPVVFYYKGNADLNVTKVISIVGTRRSTHYGRDLTEKLVSELSQDYPDLLIVSGLAYGIDIQAHRSALKNKLSTVAVLAHGLDRIYPSAHRSTAVDMLRAGGLLTDFPSGTQPDKPNFVKRNRIIAGLSDATVVIESADKGGSLITADIAFSYGRDVLSFPGRVTDSCSAGCNNLIKQNKAALISSAADLITALCWEKKKDSAKLLQECNLPFSEKKEYEQIVSTLQNVKEIHINELAMETDMPVHRLSSFLFELELNDIIKTLPGSMYTLK